MDEMNFNDVLNNTPANERVSGKGGNERLSKDEYAAKKKDERERLFTLADETALSVAGDGAKCQQYLDTQAAFDRYSTVNGLLIMAQKPEATRIADFDYWKDKGGSVKKGQTGISILAPGKEYERGDGTLAQGYDVKKVFDVSQVDTKKMKPAPTPPKYTERQIISALVTKAPMKIMGVDSLPNGGGAAMNPETGEISVLKGMSFYDNFRAITRELACAEVMSAAQTETENAPNATGVSREALLNEYKDVTFMNLGNAETQDKTYVKADEYLSGDVRKKLDLAKAAQATINDGRFDINVRALEAALRLETTHDHRADPQFTAYCASYMLCKKYGVDTKDYNFDNAPAQFADMDAQGVKRELTGIRDAVGNVAARVDRNLDALVKAAAEKEARDGGDARG